MGGITVFSSDEMSRSWRDSNSLGAVAAVGALGFPAAAQVDQEARQDEARKAEHAPETRAASGTLLHLPFLKR